MLMIDGVKDTTGSYGFRLLDFAAATPLVPGSPVTGQLDPASSTNIYQFNASAGDRFYFDLQSVGGGKYAYWRLINPHGEVEFGRNYIWGLHDVDVRTLAISGSYSLLIEGKSDAAGITTYKLNVQQVVDGVGPLTLGANTHGSIDHAGQQQQYQFTLPIPTQVCFDALTNDSRFYWSLNGPRGTVVSSRSFTNSGDVPCSVETPVTVRFMTYAAFCISARGMLSRAS